MKAEIFDNTYFITYSNYFIFENRVFAFRNKLLFDITNIPMILHLKHNAGSKGYWINRKWLSLSAIQSMIVKEPKKVDVSDLQWHEQINLDFTFNL